jgi:hypothetical protein
LREHAIKNGAGMAPHYFTANAGPWFLYQLLEETGVAVKDPKDADIIYVHGNSLVAIIYHMGVTSQ